MLRVGSLFSGIGGFDLGFESAGMKVVWQVENDPKCNMILERNFDEAAHYEDIREFTQADPVDLICGGFPCQDLSVAGNRQGLDGERSGLWWEFHRILSEGRPRWAVIENVPGLLSSNRGRDMATILGEMEKLGYWVAYRVLDSQYFGVAQRRRRVFIIGSLARFGSAEVLFDEASLQRHPEESKGQKQEYSKGARECTDKCSRRVAAPLVNRGYKGSFTDPHNDNVIAFNCQQDPVSCVNLAPGTSGGADRAIAFGENQRGEVVTKDVMSQLSTGGGKPGQGYPAILERRPRRLTPLECERLQGFPANWTSGVADTHRYRMLGNAVTVPVAEWIGDRIIGHEARS